MSRLRPEGRRPDPESLVLEELSPEAREAVRARAEHDPELAATLRIVDLLAAGDEDVWHDAETPPLRFVPDGAAGPVGFWSRVCVRGDAGEHRVPASLVGVAIVGVLLVGLLGGYLLRGGVDDPSSVAEAAAEDARMERAPAVSLVRASGAPVEAAGVARMITGDDGRMMVRVHGLRPTPRGRWYEVWMRDRGGRAVSVGTFRVRADGTATGRFGLGVDPRRYPRLEVSLQSRSDGRRPSRVSVLRSPGSAA